MEALGDFAGEEPDDLQFKKGDILTIIETRCCISRQYNHQFPIWVKKISIIHIFTPMLSNLLEWIFLANNHFLFMRGSHVFVIYAVFFMEICLQAYTKFLRNDL